MRPSVWDSVRSRVPVLVVVTVGAVVVHLVSVGFERRRGSAGLERGVPLTVSGESRSDERRGSRSDGAGAGVRAGLVMNAQMYAR